jgi:SAM-dependent methyltransferase
MAGPKRQTRRPFKYLEQTTRAYEDLATESEERAAQKMPFVRQLVEGFAPRVTTGRVVLDVGCGVGLATVVFTALGFQVTGIDVSSKMLARARLRDPSATFIRQNFLDFQGHTGVDGIFASAFIHLFDVEDAIAVLHKMHSLLKTGGVVFLSTDLCGESREGVFEKPYYKKKVKRFKRFWARGELERLAKDNGFVLDRSFVIPDYYRDIKWLVCYLSKA